MEEIEIKVFVLDGWDDADEIALPFSGIAGTALSFHAQTDSRLINTGKGVGKVVWYTLQLNEVKMARSVLAKCAVAVVFPENKIAEVGPYVKMFRSCEPVSICCKGKHSTIAFQTDKHPWQYDGNSDTQKYCLNRKAGNPDADGWYANSLQGILDGSLVATIALDDLNWRRKTALDMGYTAEQVDKAERNLGADRKRRELIDWVKETKELQIQPKEKIEDGKIP